LLRTCLLSLLKSHTQRVRYVCGRDISGRRYWYIGDDDFSLRLFRSSSAELPYLCEVNENVLTIPDQAVECIARNSTELFAVVVSKLVWGVFVFVCSCVCVCVCVHLRGILLEVPDLTMRLDVISSYLVVLPFSICDFIDSAPGCPRCEAILLTFFPTHTTRRITVHTHMHICMHTYLSNNPCLPAGRPQKPGSVCQGIQEVRALLQGPPCW